jgi:hypothetical protein
MHSVVHYIVGQLGGLGAAIVEVALAIASFVGAIAAGHYASEFTGKRWIGWAVGILALVLLLLIFGPIYQAANRIDCHQSDDYQGCIDGEHDD